MPPRWSRTHLALRAALERRTHVVGAEGVERTSTRESGRHLETVFGRVEVERLAYQAPGSTDLHSMDAALNLPREMFSHGIRRMAAKEAARASFDEVVEIVRDYTGSSIAKRQVEELAVRAAQDFDAFYEQRAAARDPKDDLLVISTDGKGVVMRHEDLREGTRKAAEKSVRKLETRLTPREKSNRKRMAQVATVYSIAPFPRGAADIVHGLRDADDVDARRPRPTDKRVWASVEKHSRTVIREAFAEALRRDPDKRRRWVVLVDGEPKQLRGVKAEARRAGVQVIILIDIVHVLEYVWAAARALFGESNAKAERWVADRLLALLTHRKWIAQGPAGRSPAPRRSCASARCAPPATSTPIGPFISSKTCNETMHHTTRTEKLRTRFPRARRDCEEERQCRAICLSERKTAAESLSARTITCWDTSRQRHDEGRGEKATAHVVAGDAHHVHEVEHDAE
jgi:hypothetical protein